MDFSLNAIVINKYSLTEIHKQGLKFNFKDDKNKLKFKTCVSCADKITMIFALFFSTLLTADEYTRIL